MSKSKHAILCVDDDKTICQANKQVLSTVDYHVIIALNVKKATAMGSDPAIRQMISNIIPKLSDS